MYFLIMSEKTKELRVILELQVFEKLDELKKYYGIHNTTEFIRFLVSKELRIIKADQAKIASK